MLPRKFHENSLIKNDFSRIFHEKYCESFMKSLHETIMNSYMKVSWTVSRNFLEKWVFWGDFSWIFLENFSWNFYDIVYMILSKNIATEFLLCRWFFTNRTMLYSSVEHIPGHLHRPGLCSTPNLLYTIPGKFSTRKNRNMLYTAKSEYALHPKIGICSTLLFYYYV